jgi:hypothetical protein
LILLIAYKSCSNIKFLTCYFKIIVDSQAIVRNNTGILFIFHQFLPCVNVSHNYTTRSQLRTDIDALHQTYSEFTSFTWPYLCVCVCMYVFNSMKFCFMCKFVWLPPQSKWNGLMTRTRLVTFYSHSHLSSFLASYLQATNDVVFVDFCLFVFFTAGDGSQGL